MKTLKEEREAIVDKLSTICKQADQYQINAGYPVETPAIKIVEALLLSHEEKVRDERDTYWKERVREIHKLYGDPKCEALHHNHLDRHGWDALCPVETRIHKTLDTLLDNLK